MVSKIDCFRLNYYYYLDFADEEYSDDYLLRQIYDSSYVLIHTIFMIMLINYHSSNSSAYYDYLSNELFIYLSMYSFYYSYHYDVIYINNGTFSNSNGINIYFFIIIALFIALNYLFLIVFRNNLHEQNLYLYDYHCLNYDHLVILNANIMDDIKYFDVNDNFLI